MKVALLQLDPTVGAVRQNVDRVLDWARKAKEGGAELAICPELTLVGYPPRDLLDRPAFLRVLAAETERLVGSVPAGLTLVVGSVAPKPPGHWLSNVALVVRDGAVVATAEKQLLPTYDVFDEARYFEPGRGLLTTLVGGARVTVSICEDAWANVPGPTLRHAADPLGAIGPENTDLLVNLSASPFTLHKLGMRPRLFAEIAAKHRVPVVLVNQVGGNDELVFDGRSAVWDGEGNLVARAPMFEEALLVVDVPGRGPVAPEAESPAEAAFAALSLGVRDYARKCGFARAVLGLSGGIDSALTAVIAADALGPENVLGVSMPTRYSSEGSVTDARALASLLGMRHEVVDIDPMFEALLERLRPFADGLSEPGPGDVTWENVQARLRGITLMAVSNRTGALVLTTGNKSEVAVGYSTLYGDMAGGLSVISDVPKTMVYEIARWVNRDQVRIPVSSIEKPPSAELRPNQKDEDSLPPYSVLDPILELYVEQALSKEEIVARGFDPVIVTNVLRLVRASEYKRRQAAPGLIITSKAFGSGRRMPIAQGFKEE